ncbi:MAG: AraC family transcriptional regulator [Planctomycetes bacterium]|nr:AraC family transcriptional regulator [Planctomycetota bacterium]
MTWRDETIDSSTQLWVVRHAFRSGQGFAPHTHEFAEVFWCESGGGVHQVNGESFPLHAGDVVFMRPDDVHGAYATARAGLTFVNVSFPAEPMRALAARYPDGEWPWRPGPSPMHVHLSPRRMERLHTWTADLSAPGQRRLDLECFLLDIARLVTRPVENDVAVGLPVWMHDVIEVFSDPRHLAGGTARFAHLAGRSQAHLNRLIRASQGRTTTDLVNVLRLQWAATALRMSDQSIADIAATCGLGHLGHFYAMFKKRFGVTPRRYRMDAWQASGK